MNQLATNTKIEEVLEEQGFFMCSTVGYSMFPMLRDRRDIVVVEPVEERLKKNDIALYKRGDGYILHRVIKVLPDEYIIRGDNCYYKEHVTDDMIIGKLTGFYRNPKKTPPESDRKPVDMNGVGYAVYTRAWRYTYGVRMIFVRFKRLCGRALRKLRRSNIAR